MVDLSGFRLEGAFCFAVAIGMLLWAYGVNAAVLAELDAGREQVAGPDDSLGQAAGRFY